MSLTVVHYGCSNPASVPIKQHTPNGMTEVPRGMPQKTGFADDTTTFAIGRQVYISAPQCHSIIKGNTASTSIRVDSSSSGKCNPVIPNTKWSYNKITIPGQRRNAKYTEPRCCANGKKTVVTSSEQYIERKKNIAIGKGSSTLGLENKQGNKKLTFNDNNENGNHTNYLTVANAKRRCRNSGYVVPPKCRGGGCNQPRGWPVTQLLG